MKNCAITYSLILSLVFISCKKPTVAIEERPGSGSSEADSRGFDPLELPGDKAIIPMQYPNSGMLGGAELPTGDTVTSSNSVDFRMRPPRLAYDSLNNQAFRVQLSTTRLFGEARRIMAIAEEIFDRKIFIDYEVPNFKVRVGGFATRQEAEQYQKKCQSAGYTNAWVVLVNLNIKEADSLYDELPPLVPEPLEDAHSDDSTSSNDD